MKVHLYMYLFEMKPSVVCGLGSFHKVTDTIHILTTDKKNTIDKLVKYFPAYPFIRDKLVGKMTLSILCIPTLQKILPKLFVKKGFKYMLKQYNSKYKKFK